MKEPKNRKELVEQALSKVGSRYLVCSLIAKRANQLAHDSNNKEVGWAINQALHELVEDHIKPKAGESEQALPASTG